MNRRFIISLLVFCCSFFGCSKGDQVSQEQNYTIGFSQCVDDMWRQMMMIQMEAEATKYPGLHLTIKEAHGDTGMQIEQIDELIVAGVDLLIVSPNESGPIAQIVEKAYCNGIPVIIWDRKVDTDEYTTFISADNYAIGHDVGEYILSEIPVGASILEIAGLQGSSPAKDRHQGFVDVIGNSYKLTTIRGDWQPAVAKARVEDLPDYKCFDLVFGQNDDMAIAAYEAILGKDPDSASRIKFIGIDAIVGVDAIIDGRLDASFLYPPGGEFVIQTAMRILKGETVEKTYTLKSSVINASNAQTLKSQSEQIFDYQTRINNQKKALDDIQSSYKSLLVSSVVLLLLAVAFLIIGFKTYTINRSLHKKNDNLEKINREIENRTDELLKKNVEIENLANQKLQFFTNLSHEIRTPLTLIINPLERMSRQEKDPQLKNDIWTLQRNARHLLKIVNQILDFRKIENNKMTLNVQEIDIVSFTEEIVKYFETYAESEHIVYRFVSNLKSRNVWVDTDKMEQVLINLISNAFKNSKKYGIITVSINDGGETIVIEVHDTGRGMDLNTQNHVFDRFFSVGNSQSHGIGIGLHLCKEYVQMHGGTLTLESELGKFSSFFVTLQKGRTHFPPDTNYIQKPIQMVSADDFEQTGIEDLLSSKFNEKLLVAEDDPDIRQYLKEELSSNFDIIAVTDGLEALKIINSEDVSIVLTDVLMPHINGFQLCKEIKGNAATSHIPVVLLTAMTDDRTQLYSIAEGADEYIRKPFNIDYVRAKLISIIVRREKSRVYFAKKIYTDKVFDVSSACEPSAEEAFVEHLNEYLEKNYENSELGIDEMSANFNLSRIQFYRKVKAIFGLSPTDILRSYRLIKSAELIKENRLTISEVAYSCGFSSPSYFTRCFKDKFNISPSEFSSKNEK